MEQSKIDHIKKAVTWDHNSDYGPGGPAAGAGMSSRTSVAVNIDPGDSEPGWVTIDHGKLGHFGPDSFDDVERTDIHKEGSFPLRLRERPLAERDPLYLFTDRGMWGAQVFKLIEYTNSLPTPVDPALLRGWIFEVMVNKEVRQGDSGGVLVDISGLVVGLVIYKIDPMDDDDGVSLVGAISTEAIKYGMRPENAGK